MHSGVFHIPCRRTEPEVANSTMSFPRDTLPRNPLPQSGGQQDCAGKPAPVRTTAWADFADPVQQSRWDALAARAAEPNPFYESWYLLPSLRALDPQRRVQLLVMEEGGELIGLLPVRRENRYYGHPLPHWRGWVHDNCFLGTPLVAAGYERQFWRAVLHWCDRHAGAALFLHLVQMPATGPVHDALSDVLSDVLNDVLNARPAATVMQEDRALLAGADNPQTYLDASLSAKKRKELRRQHRRLAETGELKIRRQRNPANVPAWTQQFLELERGGWKGQSGSALACQPETANLFREALAGAARAGRLDLLDLTLDGKPIAMLASFVCPPGAFSYKTAFDESFARFSPGVLLQLENIALLSAENLLWADSCAAQDHPMIDHIWRQRRTIQRHSIALGSPLRRAIFRAIIRLETGRRAKGIS